MRRATHWAVPLAAALCLGLAFWLAALHGSAPPTTLALPVNVHVLTAPGYSGHGSGQLAPLSARVIADARHDASSSAPAPSASPAPSATAAGPTPTPPSASASPTSSGLPVPSSTAIPLPTSTALPLPTPSPLSLPTPTPLPLPSPSALPLPTL
ncbi:MAG TPA: hypothetical protein VJO72_10025 [Candidatus Dormibacteraeota bacterium]|nr:hypothetical protein [Candidatus Dormibacteraeota bacterium]